MLTNFDALSASSKVWIYQCNRSFTAQEVEEISQDLKTFLNNWTAHGSDLTVSFQIKYNRFIIIAVDEEKALASGCSIDSMVHFIQNLEKQYSIDLMDKMNVSYKHGEYIAYKPLLDFKKMVKQKAVNENTIVFNNMVLTKQELEDYWEVPLKDSWHARFL